jgi:hypothetical protein
MNTVTERKEVDKMAKTAKQIKEEIKAKYLEDLIFYFEEGDEDVLRVGSNEIAFPIVDENGDEHFLVVTLKIPTGTRDGDPYDGYGLAEDYQMKQEEKKRKAIEAQKKKEAKIERDKAYRQKVAEMKKAKEEKG